MSIQIGAPPAESLLDNPLALLYSCHRRVDLFLKTLEEVTQAAHGTELTPEQQQALRLALRYFREAAPLHTLDEEESLFPRMHHIQNPQIKTIFETLEVLKDGHRTAENDHEKVDKAVQHWLDEGGLSTKSHADLLETLKRLSDFYTHHMQIEERDVFPLAQKGLNSSEIDAIGREMAIRRDLDPNALKQVTDTLQHVSRQK